MADDQEQNERTSSTTWQWRKVKMSQPPKASVNGSAATPPEGSLLPWPRSKPLTVVLKYRGGPEGWVEVRARGRIWRRSGDTAIYDVLCTVFGWRPK